MRTVPFALLSPACFCLTLACATAADAPPPQPTRVILAVDGIKEVRNLPALVAEREGYFKAEGLLVTLMEGREDVPTDDMLADGRIDGSVAFYHHTFEAQADGKLTESVIAMGMTPGLKLLVASRLKDEVKTLADLKGRKIFTGGPNSGKTTAGNWLVVAGGNQIGDYKPLPLQTRDKMAKALDEGAADAIVAHEPDASFYRSKGAFVLADLTTVETTKKSLGTVFPTTSLYLANSYVKAHPDTVQHLVNAFEKALRYIQAHSAEELMARMPPEIVGKKKAEYLNNLREDKQMFVSDGRMPEDAARMELKVMADFQAKYKLVRFEETFTNQFADAALKSVK